MRNLVELLKRLGRDEEGAALLEYTILLSVIAVAVILAATAVGQWVGARWTSLCSSLGAIVGTCDAAAGTGT